MARKLASTKLTSGSGYSFEDKVTAYFITCLLSSTPPLDPEFGSLYKVALQNRVDGWLLDDILLTLKSGRDEINCALSVKSNRQFTKSTAPQDFVRDAWEQYLGEETSFNQGEDRLGLVTAQLDTDTKTKLEDLLKKARSQNPDELNDRISGVGYVSAEERSLHNSFSCPDDFQEKFQSRKLLPGELLKYIEHIDFDFDHTSSKDLSHILSILKGLLKKEDLNDAIKLWETLCGLSKKISVGGGYLDLPCIVREVRNKHSLKDFPDHRHLWEKINELATNEISLIKDTIGQKGIIDRKEVLSNLNRQFEKERFILLLGSSGTGKTVVQKFFAKESMESDKVVWVNNDNLPDLSEIPFRQISQSVPDKKPILIIDGIDRFYLGTEFKKLALIIDAIQGNENSCNWKILISCQPEEWQRIQTNLIKFNIILKWHQHTIENPKWDSLKHVWNNYPELKNLSLHLHLQGTLLKPKILDVFANEIDRSGTLNTEYFDSISAQKIQIGESHLISWFWDIEIRNQENGLQKDRILKWVAKKMADDLTDSINISEIDISYLPVIESLVNNKILKRRDEKISFTHDSIADWTRQRILLDQGSNIHKFLKERLTSPSWCKALRLLGVHLLETESNLEKWQDLFSSFKEEKESFLGQDYLMEAAIFSVNPLQNLERMFPLLISEDGDLLKRFLKRFLYSASFPSQHVLLLSKVYDDELMTKLISEHRDPYWLYWIPLIQTLFKFKDDAQRICPLLTSQIVDRWLRFSKESWPGRAEAAKIAVEMAENLLAKKLSSIWYLSDQKFSESVFRAGIASCNEETERSLSFILTACCRKSPSDKILKLLETFNNEETQRRIQIEKQSKISKKKKKKPAFGGLSLSRHWPIPDPWSEGPLLPIDRDFKQVCLGLYSNIDALNPLIKSSPKIAVEIILALLIEPPEPKDPHGEFLKEDLSLDHLFGWYPPFYTNGPFFFFFNAHYEHALEFALTLINFVTDRWLEKRKSWSPDSTYIDINFGEQSKKYYGDPSVYYWHRGVPSVPDAVGSVLMALEKWLYDNLEDNKTKSNAFDAIETILQKGKSLAFIGLIISVAKKHNELFTTKLLPLLSVPEFYDWDSQHVLVNENNQMIGWSLNELGISKLAEQWHSMSHRKKMLNTIGPSLFLYEESTREKFALYREEWKNRIKNGELRNVNPDIIENLTIWFDLSNWEAQTHPEHGDVYTFVEPPEVSKKREKALSKNNDRATLLNLPFTFRKILDGEVNLPETPDEVWKAIQTVELIQIDDKDPDKDVINKNNSICGGIAVLYIKFTEWFEGQQDKKNWCIDKVVDIISSAEVEDSISHNLSKCDWKWNRFCAEALPFMWMEDPENESLRKSIISLATIGNYETICKLFTAASEFRIPLGRHFKQLQNFVVNYVLYRWSVIERDRSAKKQLLSKWISAELESFLSPDYPSKSIELLNLIKLHKSSLPKENEYHERNLNFQILESMFNWIPGLSYSNSPEERSEWLMLWKDLLSIRLIVIGESRNDKGEIRQTPSEWDQWLLRKLSIQLLDMDDSEKPNEIWEPILKLGAAGHYWVKDFLSEWFFNGLSSHNEKLGFNNKWKQMVEYAFSSENWCKSSGPNWPYWARLWCGLLGMDVLIEKIWDEEKESLIVDMVPYYNKWASMKLSDPESALYYLNFLQQPACKKLLISAIIELDVASDNPHFFTDRHNKVQNPLATFLEFSWKRYREKICNDEKVYASFKRILNKLVSMQNTQAIEFQTNRFISKK